MPPKTSQTLIEIKALLEASQKADHDWKEAMLKQFQALNGTVREHGTDIALLQQSDKRQGTDLKEVCGQVRTMEVSQAKSAAIGALVGAVIVALPQIMIAARAWVK